MKSSKYISKKSGFEVPKSYFEDFEIDFLKAENQQSKTGFLVPEGYFDSFEVKLPKSFKLIRLNEFQKTLAVAAVLLVLLGTLLTGLIVKSQPQQQLDFSKINRDEAMNYLEDEIMMDYDLYLEDENLEINLSEVNLENTKIINNMDDSSIEQLMDY
ncbi:hypothetical protein [Flavobacterium sp. CS20]|uniref:hypothetical protein n=1 Tax=Flavobacterium sp. CS20 TaxID=2775246 RepID=UPI001B39FFBF|nr:hypothetical protein [Flavobacterium sp. CS20]QTY28182.1 hypothetical protein IGB25_06790 [Flavobacterium sp. CS20]